MSTVNYLLETNTERKNRRWTQIKCVITRRRRSTFKLIRSLDNDSGVSRKIVVLNRLVVAWFDAEMNVP